MDISGQLCFVRANYSGAFITGTLSLYTSGKVYAIEFPRRNIFKKKQQLYLELKRLYFVYRADHAKNKYSIMLDYVKEDDLIPNDFNLLETHMIFLGKILGSPKPFIRINLRKIKKAKNVLTNIL